jgi:hypothetical protein
MMRRLLLVAAATLVAGCAASPFGGPNLAAGATRDAVIARMGPPQRVFRLPTGGERLEYSQQPWGQQAYMVDLDDSGRVLQVSQVLTEANFFRIVPGQWTRDDIEREFGRPAKIDAVSSWPGPVWTYRWRDRVNTDMFYWVYLDSGNIVRRAHPGIDVINAPDPKT